jgi:DNA replication protein DnaC
MNRPDPGARDPDRIDCPHCDGTGFRVDVETNTAYDCVCRPARISRRRARNLSNVLPKRYRNASLESTVIHDIRSRAPGQVRVVEHYVRDIDAQLDAGRGLWLYGGPGTGKTELAMLVSKTALTAGRSVAVYTLPRLLAEIRKTFDAGSDATYLDLLDRLAEVDLLHIDDVGAEQTSPWVLEQLYAIVNARYEEERAIVLTTNLERDALAGQIGERTVSRLEQMCEILPLFGADQRLQGGDLRETA